MEIPTDLNPACLPLAWLLGTWEGAGVGDYPTIEAFRFGQEVRFDDTDSTVTASVVLTF